MDVLNLHMAGPLGLKRQLNQLVKQGQGIYLTTDNNR